CELLERAGRQNGAVDAPPRVAQQPPDLRACHVHGFRDRHAPVRRELVEIRPGRSELDGRGVLLDDRAAALAATVDTGRLLLRRRAGVVVLHPTFAPGRPAGGIGAVDEPVAVVVDHVGATLGPGRDAALEGGGGRAGDRRGRRGDGRRGGDAQDVTLVADAVAVAAGGRAGVAVGIRAGRAGGHVREVAAPRLRVAGGRPGAGVGVVGAGLHHVVLVAAVGHAAPRGERAVAARRRAGVVVRVRARRAVGHRGVAAHPGALVAHVLGALDVVVAVRTERDGA